MAPVNNEHNGILLGPSALSCKAVRFDVLSFCRLFVWQRLDRSVTRSVLRTILHVRPFDASHCAYRTGSGTNLRYLMRRVCTSSKSTADHTFYALSRAIVLFSIRATRLPDALALLLSRIKPAAGEESPGSSYHSDFFEPLDRKSNVSHPFFARLI